jgi:hypothetical protein
MILSCSENYEAARKTHKDQMTTSSL